MSIDTGQGLRARAQQTAVRNRTAPHRSAPNAAAERSALQSSTAPSTTGVRETARETTIRAGVVESAAHDELVIDRVTPDMLRVTLDGRILGFVEHVGRVHVALAGERYDRAVEVAQTLDVAAAARALA